MVKVRILKGDSIGKVFNVSREGKVFYYIGEGIEEFRVRIQDAEVVEDIEKSCQTCNYVKPCGKKYLCQIEGDFARWIPIPPQEVNGGIAGVGQDAKPTGTTEEAKHYQVAEVQPIEIMQMYLTPEEMIGGLKWQVLKYILRIGHKDNDREDAGKCNQYATWLCDVMDGKTIVPGGKV